MYKIRHEAFALASVREIRFCVYKEAQGVRPGPRKGDAVVDNVAHEFSTLTQRIRRFRDVVW